MSKYKIFRTHDGESIIGKIVDSNRVSFLVNRPMRISISTIGICDDMEKEMTHTAMTVTLRDWIEFSKDDDIRIPKKHIVTMVSPNKGIIEDYENAKRTIENLFNLNFVPIVNENDTIATSEIKYGDNDRLASRVAQISNADCLILLSDVDGLYTKNPKIHKDAVLIKKVEKIDQNIIKLASGKTSEYGSGGMRTKIDAAKICEISGCKMAIANGLKDRPLINIFDRQICTWFVPKISKLDARKKWIASTLNTKGCLKIDEGAQIALQK